jgi:type I restriction enzyme S subunit
MMTSRATIGVIAINTTPATTNQGFITCIPSPRLCAYHIVEWIKQNLELITNVASGATFKEISRGEFRDLQIVLPPEPIEREYEAAVDPMYHEIRVLLAKNANLRRTRDLLLPKLISGALDVSKLEIETA